MREHASIVTKLMLDHARGIHPSKLHIHTYNMRTRAFNPSVRYASKDTALKSSSALSGRKMAMRAVAAAERTSGALSAAASLMACFCLFCWEGDLWLVVCV